MNVIAHDYNGFVIIMVCLVFSAFFSASETAITSLGALKARHIVNQKGRQVSQLRLWLKHPSRILTTILIFNNVFNILASAVATELATHYFKSQAVGIATGIITFLVVTFGEILPKSFARANSEKLAIISMKIISLLYTLFYPLIWIFSEFANLIIRWMGSDQALQPVITEEELEFLIELGEKTGALADVKKEMISGVFDFDETKVREIMTPRTDIIALEKEGSFAEASRLIIQTGHSRIPIYEERIDNITGVVFAKDILRHLSNSNNNNLPPLSGIMREPLFVPESKPLLSVFKELKRTKNHLAVIIDEYGGTAGIVTMEDILEEIVGDIQDEFDSEEAKILRVDKSTFDVAGSVTISEFSTFFNLEESFESEAAQNDVDTIAGWMTQHLGDLPEVGQTVTSEPLTIEVTGVERHRIEKLRVTKALPKMEPHQAQN